MLESCGRLAYQVETSGLDRRGLRSTSNTAATAVAPIIDVNLQNFNVMTVVPYLNDVSPPAEVGGCL